jgi:hypothetical protein
MRYIQCNTKSFEKGLQILLILGEEADAGRGYAVSRGVFHQVHGFVGQVQ